MRRASSIAPPTANARLPPPEGRAHHEHEHGTYQVEEELRAHEPRGRIPGQVGVDIPGLHHEEIAQEGEGGPALRVRHLEEPETGLPRHGDAVIQLQEDPGEESSQLQWIDPRDTRVQKGSHGAHVEARRESAAIHVVEDEAAEGEEELDPEVALDHEEIDPVSIRVAIPLVVMEDHDEQDGEKARPREGADLRRARSGGGADAGDHYARY